MSVDVSGNPDLPNEHTDHLAGWLGVLFPGSAGLPGGVAEQLHEVLLLSGWLEPEPAGSLTPKVEREELVEWLKSVRWTSGPEWNRVPVSAIEDVAATFHRKLEAIADALLVRFETDQRRYQAGFFNARGEDHNELSRALGLEPGAEEWHKLIARVGRLVQG